MMIKTGGGIYLLVREPEKEIENYPSCRMQKGPVLVHGNKDLSEEGIGFGVPLFRFGQKTLFPGSGCVTLKEDADRTIIEIEYDLNLREMIFVNGRRIESRTFYTIKETLSRLHREYPFLREFLTQGSITVRRVFAIETRFQEVASAGQASVEYDIRTDGLIHIRADMSRVKTDGCTEVTIMNEQGANYFDTYRDSKGRILVRDEIGSWQVTSSDEASFIDSHDGLAFTLSRVSGSRMFYGRELVTNRLAWSGVAYSISPHRKDFSYDIRIGARK